MTYPNRRALLTAAATVGATLAVGRPASAAAPQNNSAAPHGQSADLILVGGRIATMDRRGSFVSAVAVRDGRIAAVGSDDDILRLKGAETRVIPLQRRTVIPGLNDSHLHAVNGGNGYNLEVRWDDVPSLADGMRRLREQAERTPPGEWVRVVGGWSEFQFAERRMPTLEEINAVAPDTPVMVLHLYLHGLLNRAALRALGYDKNTPDPPDGEIVRDAQGNPTGLLVARPGFRVLFNALNAAPKLNREQLANSTLQFLRELNRLGITSVTDGGAIWPADFTGMQDLHREGLLTVRTAHHLYSPRAGQELADISEWVKNVSPGGDDYFRVNGIGEILTASAFDTGNLAEPRLELPARAETDLTGVIRLLAEHRWPFRIHATYDESISRILPVLEQVNREIPLDGLRWVLDHAETISPRNIERVAALRGGISVQDRLAYQGEYFVDRYGPEKAQQAQPVKRMMELGIPVGAGTDGTRLASYNPWISLRWMITGKTLGGLPVLGEAGRLDRMEALRRYTVGGAWFSGEEDKKGSLEPGKFADLAVLSADYFTVPENDIGHLESVLTITGGRIVHASGAYKHLDPPRVPVDPSWSPGRRRTVAAYVGTYLGRCVGDRPAGDLRLFLRILLPARSRPHMPTDCAARQPLRNPRCCRADVHSFVQHRVGQALDGREEPLHSASTASGPVIGSSSANRMRRQRANSRLNGRIDQSEHPAGERTWPRRSFSVRCAGRSGYAVPYRLERRAHRVQVVRLHALGELLLRRAARLDAVHRDAERERQLRLTGVTNPDLVVDRPLGVAVCTYEVHALLGVEGDDFAHRLADVHDVPHQSAVEPLAHGALADGGHVGQRVLGLVHQALPYVIHGEDRPGALVHRKSAAHFDHDFPPRSRIVEPPAITPRPTGMAGPAMA